MNLNKYIDHTNLRATATAADIERLCKEALNHNFFAVCVNSCHVRLAKNILKGSSVKVAAVVGFPLGAMSTKAKIAEAEDCVVNGADEIDMVINLGWAKTGEIDRVEKEIASIKKAVGSIVLKVILETCFLSDEEKKAVCHAAAKGGADFVKTSTGFGSGGATIEDVNLMWSEVGEELQIKASGGIRDRDTALRFINAGAGRIGTSSGITIVESE